MKESKKCPDDSYSFSIDEHMEFQQDEADTKAMFARERRSRENYNCCLIKNIPIPKGKFFDEDWRQLL